MPRNAKQYVSNKLMRRIVYTLNNYTAEDVTRIKALPDVRGQIMGFEIAPTTGTPHIQGAILFTKAIRFNTLKKMLGDGAHIAPMEGTPEQAFRYCRKDGNYWQDGDLPKPGKRNDLLMAVEHLREGKTVEDLVDVDGLGPTVVRYTKGLIFVQNAFEKKKELRQKTVVWLYGATGVGKTKTAMEYAQNSPNGYWISGENLKWFDGYHGQEVALFDDLRFKHCSFSFMLRLLDRYELQVPIKGGFVRWNPRVIFITAPVTPREMYKTDWRPESDIAQLERRISAIVELPLDKNNLIFARLKSLWIEPKKPLFTPNLAVASESPKSSIWSTGSEADKMGFRKAEQEGSKRESLTCAENIYTKPEYDSPNMVVSQEEVEEPVALFNVDDLVGSDDDYELLDAYERSYMACADCEMPQPKCKCLF